MKKIFLSLTTVPTIVAIAAVMFAAGALSGCQADPADDLQLRSMEFVHPGILHTQDEFEALWKLIDKWDGGSIPAGPVNPEPTRPNINIYDNTEYVPFEKVVEYRDGKRANRKMYAEHRAYRSWQWLRSSNESLSTYPIRGPYEIIARDGTYAGTKANVESDMTAAYQNALMWALTGNHAHANKSFEILNAYAGRLKKILGGDYRLMAGLESMPLAAAVEILRYAKDRNGNSSGFIDHQFVPIDNMIRNVWIPAMERFYGYPSNTEGNVGLAITAGYMAYGIYLNDRNIYQKALTHALEGNDNGTIAHYINHVSGQIQESDRDQGHAMLGFQLFGYLCETAWKQGDDLYSAYDNSAYRATEFITRYNTGDNNITYTVPLKFEPDNPVYWFNPQWIDFAALYPGNPYVGNPELGFWGARYPHEPGTDGRSSDASTSGNHSGWEVMYNHYVNRKGMYMPWTESYLPQNGDQRTPDTTGSPPTASAFLYSGIDVARKLGLHDTQYPYYKGR